MLRLILSTPWTEGARAAFLWLFDRDQGRQTLTLWSFAQVDASISAQDLIRIQSVCRPPAPSNEEETIETARSAVFAYNLSCRTGLIGERLKHSALSEVALEEFALPLQGVTAEVLGFVHFAIDKERCVFDVETVQQLAGLVHLLAYRISSGRKQRELDAFLELQQVGARATVKDVCDTASEVLRIFCSAENVAIFRQERGERLGAISVSPRQRAQISESVLQLASELHLARTESRSQFTTDGEASRSISSASESASREVVAVLARCVTGNGMPHEQASRPVPIATIVLTNRPQECFLGGTFSSTDKLILERICIHLSHILPGHFLRNATERISALTPQSSSSRSADERANEGDRFGSPLQQITKSQLRFADLAFQLIPAAISCHLVYDGREAPRRVRSFDLQGNESPLDGDIVLPNLSDVRHWQYIRQSRFTQFLMPVYHNMDENLALLFTLSTNAIAEHERLIIELIASEMRLQALGRLDVADQLQQLVQIRHALNVDLMAVSGHLWTTADQFKLARVQLAAGRKDQAFRLIFEEATFHKSLERARLAREELGRLFEGARILLLDLSKRDLQLSQTDIQLIVNELRALFIPECRRRHVGIEFQVDYPANVPNPIADRTLMRLAIFNLMENAIKYAHRETRLDIRYWLDRGKWKLSVANTGKFIPRRYYEDIFKPFRRVNVQESEQVMPGTGLGLPAVRQIIRLHASDGAIEVNSVPTERDPRTGNVFRAHTSFTVTLPRHISGTDTNG